MAAAGPDRRINLAVAKIIPPILLGIVIYASYAVTKQLCSKSFRLCSCIGVILRTAFWTNHMESKSRLSD